MSKHIPREGCERSYTGMHWWLDSGPEWLYCRYCALSIRKPENFGEWLLSLEDCRERRRQARLARKQQATA